MSITKLQKSIVRLHGLLTNELQLRSSPHFESKVVHVNTSEEIDDCLAGLAITQYQLMFAIECLLSGLSSENISMRHHLEIGLAEHERLWEAILGEEGRDQCRATFFEFLESLGISDVKRTFKHLCCEANVNGLDFADGDK